MRRLLVLLLVPLLAGTALAGDDERVIEPPAPIPEGAEAVPLLARWLTGGNGTEAAWGAWESRQRDLDALVPHLVARLGRELERPPKEGAPYLVHFLLDALRDLGARVPSELLVKAWRGHAAVVAWLLCFRPEPEAAHLDVFRAHDTGWAGTPWLALGDYLYEHRVPAFAARVLDRLTLRRLLRVWDRDGPYEPWRETGDHVSGCFRESMPEGLPPIPRYALSRHPFPDWILVAGGPEPVYGMRFLDRRKHRIYHDSGWGEDADESRLAWLRAWMDGVDLPPLEQDAQVNVKWTGGGQPWERRVTSAILDAQDLWRRWRDALYEDGLLLPWMLADLEPTLEWRIRDERRLQRNPIPPLPDVPFEIRWPRGARPKPLPRRWRADRPIYSVGSYR